MKRIALPALVAMGACCTSSQTSTSNDGGGCKTTSSDWGGSWGGDDGDGGGGGGGGGGGSGVDERACPAGPNTISFARNVVGPLFAGGFLDTDTMIGGTQTFTLYVEDADGHAKVLDTPYDALGDGTGFTVEDVDGPRVTVRAHGGFGYVLVRDPDGNQLGCYHIGSGTPATLRSEIVNELFADNSHGVVYATGDQTVGVAYVEAGELGAGRVVDDGAVLAAEGGTPIDWQTIKLSGTTVGTHHITSTLSTGDVLGFDAEFVDHVDAIDVPQLVALDDGTALGCFEARNRGRFVDGVTYHVTANGVEAQLSPWLGANCFDIPVAATDTEVAIVVTALDARVEATLPTTNLPPLRAPRGLVLDPGKQHGEVARLRSMIELRHDDLVERQAHAARRAR